MAQMGTQGETINKVMSLCGYTRVFRAHRTAYYEFNGQANYEAVELLLLPRLKPLVQTEHKARCKRAIAKEPAGYQPKRTKATVFKRLDYKEPYWLNYEQKVVSDE